MTVYFDVGIPGGDEITSWLACQCRVLVVMSGRWAIELSPKGQEQVARIIGSAPTVPWTVSAHAHASILMRHFQAELTETFPLPRVKVRHPYLQPPTMLLRSQVAKLRRGCYNCNSRIRRHTLFAVLCFEVPWLRLARFAAAQQRRQLQLVATHLPEACSRDRAEYLEQLAQEASGPHSRDAYMAVRRLLGFPYAPAVLPALREKDGSKGLPPPQSPAVGVSTSRPWRLDVNVRVTPFLLLVSRRAAAVGAYPLRLPTCRLCGISPAPLRLLHCGRLQAQTGCPTA